jgi:hypothetical protein
VNLYTYLRIKICTIYKKIYIYVYWSVYIYIYIHIHVYEYHHIKKFVIYEHIYTYIPLYAKLSREFLFILNLFRGGFSCAITCDSKNVPDADLRPYNDDVYLEMMMFT